MRHVTGGTGEENLGALRGGEPAVDGGHQDVRLGEEGGHLGVNFGRRFGLRFNF